MGTTHSSPNLTAEPYFFGVVVPRSGWASIVLMPPALVFFRAVARFGSSVKKSLSPRLNGQICSSPQFGGTFGLNFQWNLNSGMQETGPPFLTLLACLAALGGVWSRSIAIRFRPLSDRDAGTCQAVRNTPTRRSAVSGFGRADGWLSPAFCGAILGERPDWISCQQPCPSPRAGSCPGATGVGAAAMTRRQPSCTVGFACYIEFHAYLHS